MVTNSFFDLEKYTVQNFRVVPPEEYNFSGAGVLAKVRNNSVIASLFDAENLKNKGAVGIKEAAKYLSLGRNSVYNLIHSNELVSITIGGRRLIPTAELANFLDKATNEVKEMAKKGDY